MPLLAMTKINGERIVAILPIIGGADHDDFVEAEIITTDDAKKHTFTLQRVRKDGQPQAKPVKFTSFPKALREMRKRGGWG